MAFVVALFAVLSLLMPVLTHPIVSVLLVSLFVLFAVKAYQGSQK
jgi:uncharacterized membrane protein YdbT with pleckstrin-like domain